MNTANIVIIRVILFLINILFYCNDRHIYRNFTGTHRESHISLKKKKKKRESHIQISVQTNTKIEKLVYSSMRYGQYSTLIIKVVRSESLVKFIFEIRLFIINFIMAKE